MKRSFALIALTLTPLAFATPPSEVEKPSPARVEAEATVEAQLLGPLAKKEAARSKFSRAYQPPTERRVRVLDSAPIQDAQGGEFITFAVDARHGVFDEEAQARSWRKNVFTGCVYPQSGEVFIKRKDGYREASILLGKKTPEAKAHVCRKGSAQLAQASARAR